ncbi:MAG: PepSY domain-containing protein [Synechocystis sp.]|nr:PepSY domain-containing protein [Synechocystis sp.]
MMQKRLFLPLHLRKLHRWFASIMVFPLVLTSLTGSLFQVAIVMGEGDNFYWLLDWHRGHFGRINLEMIYPFLNAFGLLMLVVTGVLMWLKLRR